MAVYVDQLFRTQKTRQWPFLFACHMWADSSVELYEMAGRLGLSRRWVQHEDDEASMHFDLTPSRRQKAVLYGAVETDARALARRRIEARAAARNEPIDPRVKAALQPPPEFKQQILGVFLDPPAKCYCGRAIGPTTRYGDNVCCSACVETRGGRHSQQCDGRNGHAGFRETMELFR